MTRYGDPEPLVIVLQTSMMKISLRGMPLGDFLLAGVWKGLSVCLVRVFILTHLRQFSQFRVIEL